jgi:hypothetical protein
VSGRRDGDIGGGGRPLGAGKRNLCCKYSGFEEVEVSCRAVDPLCPSCWPPSSAIEARFDQPLVALSLTEIPMSVSEGSGGITVMIMVAGSAGCACHV